MTHLRFLGLLLGALLVCGCSSAAHDLLILEDVAVVDPVRGEISMNRRVVVRGAEILAIESAGGALPRGAEVIEAQGRYLLPGLMDLHSHVWRQEDLWLNLAAGVTTVRNLSGSPQHLVWRQEIAEGRRLGPTLITSGPVIDGDPPTWPGSAVVTSSETARQVVEEQRKAGYDLLKIYNRLSAEGFEALVQEARRAALPIAGHVPQAVGIEGALAAGIASVEHLRGYVYALAATDSPYDLTGQNFRSQTLAWTTVDETRFEALAELTAASGAWNCPTLSDAFPMLLPPKDFELFFESPEMRYLSPEQRRPYDRKALPFLAGFSDADFERALEGVATKRRFVRALADAGAGLLLGSDHPPAGFALHDEIQEWSQAGFTPAEILAVATFEGARFLGLERVGTIEDGWRADLLLVDSNPLVDLTTLRSPAGVMAGGVWLSREHLEAGLEAIARGDIPESMMEGLEDRHQAP